MVWRLATVWTVRGLNPCSSNIFSLKNFSGRLWTQPASYSMCTVSFSGGKCARCAMLSTQLHQVPRLRMSGAITLLPPVRLFVVDRDNVCLPVGPNPAYSVQRLGCDMEDQESSLVTGASLPSLKAAQLLIPWGSKVKRPGIEYNISPQFSAQNKNEWNYSCLHHV